MWLKAEGFEDVVRQWWSSYQFVGNVSFILANKLKCLKNYLKKWNAKGFGKVGSKRKYLFEELLSLEGRAKIAVLLEEAMS